MPPPKEDLLVAADFLDDGGFANVAALLRSLAAPPPVNDGTLPMIGGPADGRRAMGRYGGPIRMPVSHTQPIRLALDEAGPRYEEMETVVYEIQTIAMREERYGNHGDGPLYSANYYCLPGDRGLALEMAFKNYRGRLTPA